RKQEHHQDKLHLSSAPLLVVVVGVAIGRWWCRRVSATFICRKTMGFLEVNSDGKVPLIKLDENECLFLMLLWSKYENGASEQGNYVEGA
ncbi:hypothetical protein M8C21_025302, partial [Ambrosia artemisiifolia]